MLRHVSLIACLALMACDTVPPTVVSPDTAPVVTQAAVAQGGFGGLMNNARATAGLSPATPDPRLTAAAQAHADDMVRQGYFSHTGLNGAQFTDRMRAAGYTSCNPSENIGGGQTSEAAALESWMGSSAHRANILMPGTVQYGLGRAGDKWVLLVARVC